MGYCGDAGNGHVEKRTGWLTGKCEKDGKLNQAPFLVHFRTIKGHLLRDEYRAIKCEYLDIKWS
jgi:hypothetical protein